MRKDFSDFEQEAWVPYFINMWPNLGHYSIIRLDVLSKTARSLSTVGTPVIITGHIPNKSRERHRKVPSLHIFI
jgi:hypothetical protein